MNHMNPNATAAPARTNEIGRPWRRRGLMMGFAGGVLSGSLVASEAAAACAWGETVDLIDPTVIVVAGPGNPATEEALWLDFRRLYLEGPQVMHLDGFWAMLERTP